jgi:K+-sensing histidine kinase KdpD
MIGAMDEEGDLIYLAGGPLAAIILGMGLSPLRTLTPASNFAFVFMALTIVVAEFGGRRAAVATALTSALSLDFFLTQPYLRLTIEDKHDIIAFVGLAVCGLIAAAFGSQRSRRTVDLERANTHLDLLHLSLRRVEEAGPPETALADVVKAVRGALPVSAVVVRDEHGNVVAASERGPSVPTAAHALAAESLLASGEAGFAPQGQPFPVDGGRIELYFGNRRVGALEVWGNGSPASEEDRRTLADLARAVGAVAAAHRTLHTG